LRPNGAAVSLAHLHPFRFAVGFEIDQTRAARVVDVHVGLSCHVFTCAIEKAIGTPELYFDRRETRAFDHERYALSFRLRGIVAGLESIKCYFVSRDRFVTVEGTGTQLDREYRVFFTMRRRDASVVELIVQSAYVGKKEVRRPRGQAKRPIRFRSIVGNLLSKRRLVEAP
jgi:hypothetical protein